VAVAKSSREFADLAGRFNARVEPAERVLPGPVRQTAQQLKRSSTAAAAARSKKFDQWHRDGMFFEEARSGGARQAGTEPDRWGRSAPADDPWREDRWARQWHKRDDPWGNEP
jgi:hypothetical protein